MSNTIIQTETGYEIYFKYHPVILDAVRLLPNRSYRERPRPHWYCPKSAEQEVVKFATRYKFAMNFGKDSVSNPQPQHDFSDLSIPDMPDLNIPYSFKRTPFPYQLKGVAYALQKKRVLVGDQMGLGKTGQSIMAMVLAEALPLLIICPKTLCENWKREISLWTNKRAVILDKHIKNRWPLYLDRGIADVVICNYESLEKYFVNHVDRSVEKITMSQIKFNPKIDMFKGVIVDESHRCKNSKTLQAKFVKGITAGKEYILLLSGTPVVNKPDDLIAQLAILGQLDKFGGYKTFKQRYCDNAGSLALKHLNAELRRTCYYRREKSEVLTDLPPKIRQVVYCDISTRKEYEEAEQNLIEYMKLWKQKSDEEIEKSMRGEIMVRIGTLKNISARGKLEAVCEYITEVLDSGEKLVVFANLKEIIKAINNRFPHAVTITGDTPHDQRQANVDSFQKDPRCKLILCSTRAAGVGITLTAASRVATVEFDWHPAIHDQAEDRCHRIGQAESVMCTYFAGKDTIDEQIYQLIEQKRDMSNDVTGAVNDVNTDIINDVMTLFDDLKFNKKEEPKDEFNTELFPQGQS